MPPAELPLHVNCGSPDDWTAPDGTTWVADHAAGPDGAVGPGGWCRHGGGATRREADLPLAPESHAGLLRWECHGLDGYRVDLPPGRYRVELVVAETFETLGTLERSFPLRINGEVVAEAVQPGAIAGGFARAGVLTIDGVAAGEDGLYLAFGPKACCSGLAIAASEAGERSVTTRALAPFAPPPPPEAPDARRVSVLFVGHSGTFFWAIPETVQRMVALGCDDLRLEVDHVYHGGKDCRFFAEAETVGARLAEGGWDHVVLQDSSRGPVESPEVFEEWMPRLIARVREHGAEPILYAYTGPKYHSDSQRRLLMDRYAGTGADHRVPVVPCAAALVAAMAERPERNFHNPDDHHMGLHAGYLYAATFYRRFTGRSAGELPEATTLAGHVALPRAVAGELAACADAACAGLAPILR